MNRRGTACDTWPLTRTQSELPRTLLTLDIGDSRPHAPGTCAMDKDRWNSDGDDFCGHHNRAGYSNVVYSSEFGYPLLRTRSQ
jgi:hypothetical protein